MQIDEADPDNFCIDCTEDRLCFYNPTCRPVDISRLRDAILAQENRKRIKYVETSFESLIESAWFLPLFPCVEQLIIRNKSFMRLDDIIQCTGLRRLHLHLSKGCKLSYELLPRLSAPELSVCTRTKDDARILGKCIKLAYLGILFWPNVDLEYLSELRLKSIYIEQGRLMNTVGLDCTQLTLVRTSGCSHLTDVGSLKTPVLAIRTCNHLDVASIGKVNGLERLLLNDQRNLVSFDFIKKCKMVKDVAVISRVKEHDLMPLGELRSLLIAETWLGKDTNQQVLKLSKLNENLLIGNKYIHCYKGKKISPKEFRDMASGVRGDIIL